MQNTQPSNKQTKVFICTRPSLVNLLADLGYTYRVRQNIFDRDKLAWEFTVTENLAFIVHDFYEEKVGKPAPGVIEDVVKKASARNV